MKRLVKVSVLALALVSVLAACSSSVATPTTTTTGTPGGVTLGSKTTALGEFLVGPTGMTLYVNSQDTANQSSVTGTELTNWPPLTVANSSVVLSGPASAAGVLNTFARSDGTLQVTYNGMPLYYFGGDSVTGDTTGQGKLGFWSVALINAPMTSPSAMDTSSAMTSPSAMSSPSDTSSASMSASPSASSSY
jgi:predicted lipoprotein with Yx(FWY)xxD motif